MKISRPVVYTVVAAAAAYAYVVLTQPDTPPAHHTLRIINKTASSAAIAPEDDTSVRFQRYAGGNRDPFLPGIIVAKAGNGERGQWQLTGINTINGVLSALIENSSSGNSVFLQPGDTWNGLKVIFIGPDSVILENAVGQHTEMTFGSPNPDAGSENGASSTVPSMSAVSPLPPLTPSVNVQPAQAFSGFPAQSAPRESSN